MAGRPAYDRESYLEDIRTLTARGWTRRRIARHLHISTATLYRILEDGRTTAPTTTTRRNYSPRGQA